jgi:hypothetical protein
VVPFDVPLGVGVFADALKVAAPISPSARLM